MDTETIIRELERVEEKHKHDEVFTGQFNIAAMAHDVRKRLEELKPYEDAGLTPEEIEKLKERDTAKVPNKRLRHRGGFETCHCPNCDTSYQIDGRYTITDEYCPICGKLLDSAFESFCANCGQRISPERSKK